MTHAKHSKPRSLILDDLEVLTLTGDICSRIDNSSLTQRISKLNPTLPSPSRRKLSLPHKSNSDSASTRVIPELRNVIEVLKTRLNSTFDLTAVSRPSTRVKISRCEAVPPGMINFSNKISGGYRFSQSPRLQEQIYHQMSRLLHKSVFQGEIEKNNKKEAKHAADFNEKLKVKNRGHNIRVGKVRDDVKLRKALERQVRKEEYKERVENLEWKKNKEAIVKAKGRWTKVVTAAGIISAVRAVIFREKLRRKKMTKVLCFLQVISKVIGRFIRVLKKKRKYLKYKTVSFATGAFELWIKHERDNFSKIVSRNAWRMVNSNHIILLLAFWKRSVYKIQKSVKNYFFIRESRVTALTKMYNKLMANGDGIKALKNTNMPMGSMLSIANVTSTTKRKIIIAFLRGYLQNYAIEGHLSRSFLLYSNKEALISYFLIASNGLSTSFRQKRRSFEFFSQFN